MLWALGFSESGQVYLLLCASCKFKSSILLNYNVDSLIFLCPLPLSSISQMTLWVKVSLGVWPIHRHIHKSFLLGTLSCMPSFQEAIVYVPLKSFMLFSHWRKCLHVSNFFIRKKTETAVWLDSWLVIAIWLKIGIVFINLK